MNGTYTYVKVCQDVLGLLLGLQSVRPGSLRTLTSDTSTTGSTSGVTLPPEEWFPQ